MKGDESLLRPNFHDWNAKSELATQKLTRIFDWFIQAAYKSSLKPGLHTFKLRKPRAKVVSTGAGAYIGKMNAGVGPQARANHS